MSDVIEISYTGDLLAHRRCPRSWAYEKHAGFHPYEQVQAMEGRLVHHAMEWMTKFHNREGRLPTRGQVNEQLSHFFRVLWSRGMRTAFTSKQKTLDRVLNNLFPGPKEKLHPTVRAVILGPQHTEYELRAVRKLLPLEHDGKQRLLLTGILDVVVQQQEALKYDYAWVWDDRSMLEGKAISSPRSASTGDLEIWDYKGTRAHTPYLRDYVLQLLTYANLYHERTGQIPIRCVLFFVNEPQRKKQLLPVPVDTVLLDEALAWTIARVKDVQATIRGFQDNPCSIHGGSSGAGLIDDELASQCTACGLRYDCTEYRSYLSGGAPHPDTDILNVEKN